MSKHSRTGLVVGKFCPLHHGHESVIGRAHALCDDVIVISYTKPEFEGCNRARREQWIKELFPSALPLVIDDDFLQAIGRKQGIDSVPLIPHNDAPEQDHRDFVGWLCWSVLRKTVDAVFTSEAYGDGFASVLTEYFRARDADFGAVKHVCVDQARNTIPVSGTLIRSNPYAYRHFLSAAVYASFVQRICVLGGESSGKTTLTQALAERLQTTWVPEYGRELWDSKSGELAYQDMLQIGITQLEREAALAREAKHWLVCDTSPLTTLFYSLDMFGKADPELERLAEQKYDHVFVCAPDFPFVQDGTRRDPSFRGKQHQWYLNELQRRRIDFTVVSGIVEQRVAIILQALDAHIESDAASPSSNGK